MRGIAFWQVTVFLLEAAVFILIGFSLRGVLDRVGGIGVVIESMGGPVLVIVAAVTLARFGWIFGSDALLGLLKRSGVRRANPLGAPAATVMSWAGMRGVVTLTVALTLPEAMPARDLMLVTAFAVILVTVLVQGTTLGMVIRLAGLSEDVAARPPLDLFQAEAAMLKAQFDAVESRAYGPDGALIHPRLLDSYRRRATISASFPGSAEQRDRDIAAHYDLVLAAVAAGRAELVRLHRTGQVDDETLHNLEHDLDLEELGAIAAKG
jgi:hypothetical protein